MDFKLFSLLDISFDRNTWIGFSIATFGSTMGYPRSLLSIVYLPWDSCDYLFGGSWDIDVFWINIM